MWGCRMSADMNKLTEDDLYEGVEGIISASDVIEKTDGRPTPLHLIVRLGQRFPRGNVSTVLRVNGVMPDSAEQSRPSSPATEPPRRGIPRRTLAKGVAWATPVVTIAQTAPMFAASGVYNCTGSTTTWTANSTSGTQTAVISATGGTCQLKVTMSSTMVSGCATTRNMTVGTQGLWTGGPNSPNNCSNGTTFTAAPSNALILNNTFCTCSTSCNGPNCGGVFQPVCASCGGEQAAQDIRFAFTTLAGAPLTSLTSLALAVYDISSNIDTNLPARWTGNYYDAVGFSVAPTSITRDTQNAGTGTGSLTDPFRRSTQSYPTSAGPWTDTFNFASIAGNTLTMRYSNYGTSAYGTQAIAVTGFSLKMPCTC